MEVKNPENSAFSSFDHIGIVVKDLNSKVEFLKSLGWGPFRAGGSSSNTKRELPGKPSQDIKMNIQMTRIGPLRVELTEPVIGDTPQKNFLETKGEGIDHISFRVNDVEKESAELVKKGFKVTYKVNFSPDGGCVYLESGELEGIAFELLQPPTRI